MLILESTRWPEFRLKCPHAIIRPFKEICHKRAKCRMYHVLIAFMYAVVQGDLDISVCSKAEDSSGTLLEEIADDNDDLDAFKIRIKKDGVTINPTKYVEEFFYLK